MRKVTPAAILITVMIGLFSWAGTEIRDLGKRVPVVESKVESNVDKIKSLQGDIKSELRYIRKRVDKLNDHLAGN
jgi:hypothetical protein